MQPDEKDRRILALEAENAMLRSQLIAANTTDEPSPTSHLQLKQVTQSIVEVGVQLTGAEFGAFFYNSVDENGHEQALHSAVGEVPPAVIAAPLPIYSKAGNLGFDGIEVIRCDDILGDDCYGLSKLFAGLPPERVPVRSYLGAPVKVAGGSVLGGVVFGHRKPGMLDQRAERTVLGIAQLAGLSLEYSKLLRTVIYSERRFRALIENNQDGIVIVNDEDIITYASPALELIEGYRPDEVIGTDATSMIHPDDQGMMSEHLERVLNNPGVPFTQLCRRRHKSGKWVALEGTLINLLHDPAVRGIVVNFRDVTERHRNQEAMVRSQKMEALGTLAGGIAHDFNNLLLAITGNATLASADLEPKHPAQRSVAEISKAARRASDLVGRILAFSRQQEPKRELIQLRPVLEEVLSLLRASLPTTIHIETSFGDDVPTISGDTSQIHQVMMNLIGNAAHAIGREPGEVRITTQAVQVDGHTGEMLRLAPGPYAHVSVSDTGCGMSRVTMERIFDPFFTTKPSGQGTGLGLSVVHGIVKSHQGAITVYSELGKGSVFHLYFPADKSGASTTTRAKPAAVAASGEHVLYVDDDSAIVDLTARILRRSGYRVTGFDDPMRAVDAFRAEPESFDVVVTDLSMPQMSGFEVANELHAIRPDIPILMTSGYVRPGDKEAARAAGIRELILKPNTIEELGQALSRVFKQLKSSGGD